MYFLIISIVVSGVSNYMEIGQFNPQFYVGWAVDAIAGTAIFVGSTALGSGEIVLSGFSMPLRGVSAVVAGVSDISSRLLENPISNLKKQLY